MKTVFRHYRQGRPVNDGGHVTSDAYRYIRDAMRAARAAGQMEVHHHHADGDPRYSAGFPVVNGATICQLVDESTGAVVATGYAFCSKSDQFNRRIGRRIAEGRAWAAAGLGQTSKSESIYDPLPVLRAVSPQGHAALARRPPLSSSWPDAAWVSQWQDKADP